MTKLAIYFTIILATTIGALRMLHVSTVEETPLMDAAEQRRMAELAINYGLFKNGFQSTLQALGRREITLAEAHARIRALSLQYYPAYLEHLKLCEEGASTEERVARNLIGHIDSLVEFDLSSKPHLPTIEAELACFLFELECGPKP
jgi:hypothetical protein